ncbi:MAG: YbaN family protein, partial [Promethearchaeota archaeon]
SAIELNDKKPRKKILKALYFIGGTLSLALGIIGIVIPILPTTPFLLLAAACYARSSEKFYNWLLNNRILGSYIRNYIEGKGMPIKVKIFTISMLWITILISAFLIIQIFWIRVILIVTAISVSIHIILIRPKEKAKSNIKFLGIPGIWIVCSIYMLLHIQILWIRIILISIVIIASIAFFYIILISLKEKEKKKSVFG